MGCYMKTMSVCVWACVYACTEYGTGMHRRICLHSYHSKRWHPVNFYITVDIRSGAGEGESLTLGTKHPVTLVKWNTGRCFWNWQPISTKRVNRTNILHGLLSCVDRIYINNAWREKSLSLSFCVSYPVAHQGYNAQTVLSSLPEFPRRYSIPCSWAGRSQWKCLSQC